jgi:antirestriction protein ArdC
MAAQHTKESVQEQTTARILAALESGKIPWENPVVIRGLHDGMQFNPTTDRPYRGGVNTILLWLSAQMNGWADPRWMGRGQAKKAGFSIKGLTNAKGTAIFAPIMRRFQNDEGEWIQYVKGFREVMVFNAQQVGDVPSIEEQYEIPEIDPEEGFEQAARILSESGANVVYDTTTTPCYIPALDQIRMPEAGQFDSVSAFWSTMMHELTHWTGADSRLKRGMFGKGPATYAYEELVAEMGSAFLCALLGIEKPSVTKNHEAYIQHWIQRLNNDKSVFMDASRMGWNAAQYLNPASDKYLKSKEG